MGEHGCSEKIAGAIRKCLSREGFRFYTDRKEGTILFPLAVEGVIRNLLFIIDIRESSYLVYAHIPVAVPSGDFKKKAAMAEFLSRANYGLTNGNFEFDWEDGSVRYKSYVDCEGAAPSRMVVLNSICRPGAMCERYLPGMLDIALGTSGVRDALAKCGKGETAPAEAHEQDSPDDCLDEIMEQFNALFEREDAPEGEARQPEEEALSFTNDPFGTGKGDDEE